ncbi:hypothetical protein EYZ11_010470 [Aspergillus tanneri]|uniref:Major facilitator superfamily (MFS) profile domain-containing protein n=1 Tax=Aspergillus tanneri TaxID=1220188 RepID=A0A4V3UN72_9EURO|nr:hypothetical protein EYZ11_010470 [Aspergillus tanneri]
MKDPKNPTERVSLREIGEFSGVMDQAVAYLSKSSQYPPMSPEVENKLVRKLDWILVPMLLLTATLGAVDKVAISTAAIYGLKDGNRRHVALILPGPEAPVSKIFILLCLRMVSYGYVDCTMSKMEWVDDIAVLYGSVINGFLSWAVGHIPNSAPLATWQYLYLIIGTISITWSIFAFIFLPDTPMTACFLSEQEKYYAVQRVAENKTGIVNKQWKWNQALEAVIDPKTWILFFFNIAISIPNGGNGFLSVDYPTVLIASRPYDIQWNYYQQPRVHASQDITAQYADWDYVYSLCILFLLVGGTMD